MITLFLLALACAQTPPPAGLPTRGTVVSVYDGDTFTLATGEKIRLRGANTPELKPHEPLSDEARQFTHDLVQQREVVLEATTRDGYGRVVASAAHEGRDLALALVEAGLAHVFHIPPDPLDLAPLLAAQDRARAERRGIWATDAFQGPLHVTSFHADARGPDDQNVHGEYARVCNISAGPVDLSGFRVREEDGAEFVLPDVRVPAGHTVIVRAGRGVDDTDPGEQLVVHLVTDGPIFDNDGARFELLDASGRAVSLRLHKGGGASP